MQLSSSLRRPVALAGAAALLALPTVASAETQVNVDDTVNATIETTDGIQKQGPLEADPFTYTVKSRVQCEEPYVDGARTSFLQGASLEEIPTNDMPIVMSGIDGLVDGKAVNPIDASFVDFANKGEAKLLIECVKIDNGIPQVAPNPIVQDLTITEDEWQMNGISFTEVPDPTPAPSDDDGADAGADDGGTGENTGAVDPADPSAGDPAASDGADANDPGKTEPSKQAPAKPSSSSGTQSGARGFMPRTGAEIAATAVLALALIGGGAFALTRMRKN